MTVKHLDNKNWTLLICFSEHSSDVSQLTSFSGEYLMWDDKAADKNCKATEATGIKWTLSSEVTSLSQYEAVESCRSFIASSASSFTSTWSWEADNQTVC